MPLTNVKEVKGSRKTLPNGSVVVKVVGTKKDGTQSKPISRIVKGSSKSASTARTGKNAPITVEQAQRAFDLFYKRTRTLKRGSSAGTPRFKSPSGRLAARTYDLGHTGKVVADRRYLTPSGPFRYDFQGVDTGSKARKVPSSKQASTLAAARAKLAAKRKALKSNVNQVAGYWW
jgi:hypothetical protein